MALIAALVGCAGVASMAAAGGRAVAKPAARPAATAALVPVWVLVDGDTPVRGGHVRIYAGDLHASSTVAPVSARRLRLLTGGREQRTSASGQAFLELRKLPHNFTVVVSGGRAGGHPLSGSFSAEVHGYRRDAVVFVDPVTTLVELWRRVDPRVSTRHATRAVHRALGIPASIDDIDLGSSRRWFDANRFLRSSARGTHAPADIRRETSDLVFSVEHGARTPHFHARDPRTAFRAGLRAAKTDNGSPIAEWWKQVDVRKLINDGLKDLGTEVLKWGAGAAGKWLLGHVLEQWGLHDLFKDDTKVIIEMMKELTAKAAAIHLQVDSVKQAVGQTEFNVLVAQSDKEVGAIKDLWADVQYVAAFHPKDPSELSTKRQLSRNVVSDIYTQLVKNNVAATLNQALAKELGEGILKAASHKFGTKRFFTQSDSMAIQGVYDYYALTQLRLAALVTEYWSAQPPATTACSPPCVKKQVVEKIDGNVEAQKGDLKPPLPSGKFIDTRSWLMWDTKPQWVSGARYAKCYRTNFIRGGCDHRNPQVDPATDLGTKEQFKGLVEDWNVKAGKDGNKYATPLAYLEAEAGLKVSGFQGSAPHGTPNDHLGHIWLGPTPVLDTCGCLASFQLTRINLVDTGTQPHVFYNHLKQLDPQFYFAYRMTRIPVAQDAYLWPFGSG